MSKDRKTHKAVHDWKSGHGLLIRGLLEFYPLGQRTEMPFHLLSREDPQVLTIGRGPSCSISIDDNEASRLHARVEPTEEGWGITDCASTNGVFINGHRLRASGLVEGAILRIGTTFFRFMTLERGAQGTSCPIVRTGLVGGPSIEAPRRILGLAAGSDLTLLLTGETGTGKEVAARHVHASGHRQSGPFVPVNCAALPAELVESELFGRTRGAYTGATHDSPGMVREAEHGTLFLDEIAELPMPHQAKLLRLLQDRRVQPVGSSQSIPVDVRFICATNSDLDRVMAKGGFRGDLYARIADLTTHLPPLRDRREDIPLLVHHLLERHGAAFDGVLPVEVVELLCCCAWPHNVRQLESAVRQALLQVDDPSMLNSSCFPEEVLESAAFGIEDQEATLLVECLRDNQGDVNKTASGLGISRSQLYRRAQRYGIQISKFRSGGPV
jgi:transcriptional regulator of acetoin/glycerol metabolism